MGVQILIDDDTYEGSYVALRSFADSTVLAHGDDPQQVTDEARQVGVLEPVVVYIPRHDTTCLY